MKKLLLSALRAFCGGWDRRLIVGSAFATAGLGKTAFGIRHSVLPSKKLILSQRFKNISEPVPSRIYFLRAAIALTETHHVQIFSTTGAKPRTILFADHFQGNCQ